MSTRRARIEAMLQAEPKDIFLRYSLAMELAKEGDHERSLAGFRELASESPPYIPAYFRWGQQLVDLNRISDARSVLRDGIEAARQLGDFHAAGEMGDLLTSLGAFGET